MPGEGRGARSGPDPAETAREQSVSLDGEMAEAAGEVSEIRSASEIRTPQVEGSRARAVEWFLSARHC